MYLVNTRQSKNKIKINKNKIKQILFAASVYACFMMVLVFIHTYVCICTIHHKK